MCRQHETKRDSPEGRDGQQCTNLWRNRECWGTKRKKFDNDELDNQKQTPTVLFQVGQWGQESLALEVEENE